MIRLNSIVRSFGTNTLALNSISILIKKNEFILITGKSGSGKSTLLNVIGLLDCPNSGSYLLNGKNMTSLNDKLLSKIRSENFGYIFQNYNLEGNYTVYENVEVPLLIQGKRKKNYNNQILETLKELDILNKVNEKAKNLSGGEAQRVSIARAIASGSKIILADEPCGALDTHNSINVMNILDKLHKKGYTIILVTHHPEEAYMATRTITLVDGVVVNNV